MFELIIVLAVVVAIAVAGYLLFKKAEEFFGGIPSAIEGAKEAVADTVAKAKEGVELGLTPVPEEKRAERALAIMPPVPLPEDIAWTREVVELGVPKRDPVSEFLDLIKLPAPEKQEYKPAITQEEYDEIMSRPYFQMGKSLLRAHGIT